MRTGIGSIPNIEKFTEGYWNSILGWGRKKSGSQALRRAESENRPFLLLEDGFLRSVGREDPPLSLVLDDLGIYYDATSTSRLEQLIHASLAPEEEARARALIAAWRRGRVSKYNAAREFDGELPRRYVLVVDQVSGDLSVRFGMGEAETFRRMLVAALAENPDCAVVIKSHPDCLSRGSGSYLGPEVVGHDPRVRFLAGNWHPVRLIENAERVYTVTSQIGFEALIWGKPVRCFGMPFYAGWGLTDDAIGVAVRRGRATLEQLVYAALVRYPRYVDPETGERCEVERIIDYLAFQRRMRERLPRRICAVGFSAWKRPILGQFMVGADVSFHQSGAEVAPGSVVAVWGDRDPGNLPADVKRLRVEDGFLRSVGLGAELTRPLSWVIDDLGIYYDASRESRLERILAGTEFAPELLGRARALREAIVRWGLSKYNAQRGTWRRPEGRAHVILIPGQVEDDASVRHGSPHVRSNLELIRRVREMCPRAYLVYKPHPDVVAALRSAGRDEEAAAKLSDEVVVDAALPNMLQEVDEVHTITSLAGFEALLRQVPVTCHGQPFYSGWGLTRDVLPHPRRTRRLTLDELVAGALILYPVYVSRKTGHYTTPEQVVRELVEWREQGEAAVPLWQRAYRQVMRLAGRWARVRPPVPMVGPDGRQGGADVPRSS